MAQHRHSIGTMLRARRRGRLQGEAQEQPEVYPLAFPSIEQQHSAVFRPDSPFGGRNVPGSFRATRPGLVARLCPSAMCGQIRPRWHQRERRCLARGSRSCWEKGSGPRGSRSKVGRAACSCVATQRRLRDSPRWVDSRLCRSYRVSNYRRVAAPDRGDEAVADEPLGARNRIHPRGRGRGLPRGYDGKAAYLQRCGGVVAGWTARAESRHVGTYSRG